MNRLPRFLSFILILQCSLYADDRTTNVRTVIRTESRDGRLVQQTETIPERNPFPSASLESTLRSGTASPQFNNSLIRWVSSDLTAIGQDVAVSPDGNYEFIGWNLNSPRASFHDNTSSIPLWEDFSDPSVYRNFLALSADAGVVANASYHELNLLDMNSGTIISTFVPPDGRIAGPVAVTRDGSLLVCATISPLAGGMHRVYAFSPPSSVPIWSFEFSEVQSTGVYGINISVDGSTVAVNGKFYGWVLDAVDGSLRTEIELGNTESRLAMSADASVLAVAELNGYVKAYLWDENSGEYELLWQFRIPPGIFTNWASSVDVSADGLTLMAGTLLFLSAGNDGSVYLFDTFGDGTPLWTYEGVGDYVDEIALSDDGSLGAVATWGDLNNAQPDILVFERASNVPVFTVNTPGSMFSLAMSSDGGTVIAGGKAVHARFFGNGGNVYNVEVDLGGGAIAGTVTLDGAPDDSGALVSVLGTTRTAITDPTGAYVVENVPAGIHDVRISKLGYVAQTVSGVTVVEDDTTMNINATLFTTGAPPMNLSASHGLDSRIELSWLTLDLRREFEQALAADPLISESQPGSRSAKNGSATGGIALARDTYFEGIPDSIRIYRGSRSGGPYYAQATMPGNVMVYVDSAVFPLRDYYYTVTAIYGEGESIYSNEAVGTVDSSFLQFSITTPHRTVTPTIDGTLSGGEWDDALKVDVSDIFGYGGGVPLPRGSTFMYFKYDSTERKLYIAGEDFLNNDALTDAEGFGLYFDDNNNNTFEPIGTNPLTREGNYWAYYFGAGPLVRFREIYTGGGVNAIIDTVWDAAVGTSVATGHLVAEVSLPIGFFDKNHLQVYGPEKKVGAGLFMINRLSGAAVFHGWWPQTMSSVFSPSGFGDITIPINLLAPPEAPTNVAVDRDGGNLLVTWTDPAVGINGDPLTVPFSIELTRNGSVVGEFGAGEESYTDTSVAPLGWYEYKLRGSIDVSSATEYFGPYSETVGAFAVDDPSLYEIRYDDGIPEAFYVVDFTYNDNKFGIRFTPTEYPATVYRVEAFTNNGNSPILVSIYDDAGGSPGNILTGEYEGVTHQTAGIDSFTVTIPGTDPPTIDNGDFWVVLSYLPTSPGAPGIGGDFTAPIDSRSSYYTATSGWVPMAFVDLVVRASVTGSTVGAEEQDQLPTAFLLHQNFPNPFNPSTRIRFELPVRGKTTLMLYDILGQSVRTLLDRELEAGIHNMVVDAEGLTSGVYFYRIQSGDFVQTKKMILMR